MYRIDIKDLAPFIEKELPLLDDDRYNDEYFCNAVAQDACYEGQFFYDTGREYFITYEEVRQMYQDYQDNIGGYSNFRQWFNESTENGYIREVLELDDDFQECVENTVRNWMIENDLYTDK